MSASPAGTSIDALKRECRTLESYVDQRLQSRPPQSSKTQQLDVEAGASDPESQRLVEIDDALTKLSDAVTQLSQAASQSGIRANIAVATRYRDVVQEFRGEYRRQLASLRARRENELLYADIHGRRGGAGDGSATDLLLRERSSLTTGASAVDEILQQAARTKEALASQRGTLLSAAGRLGNIMERVPGIQGIMRSISRYRVRNDVVLGLTIAACVCFLLWWAVLPS